MTVGHMQYPRSSHNSAAEYTVAGIPYVTSSVYNEVTSTAAIQVSFPYVTQWISVQSVGCLLYTSPSPRDATLSRMPSSA